MRYLFLSLPLALSGCFAIPVGDFPTGVGFGPVSTYQASRPLSATASVLPKGGLPERTANASANLLSGRDDIDLSAIGIRALEMTSDQMRTTGTPVTGGEAYDLVLAQAAQSGGTMFHTGNFQGRLTRIRLDGQDYAAIRDFKGPATVVPAARNEALAAQADALTGCRSANIFTTKQDGNTYFVLPLTCAA